MCTSCEAWRMVAGKNGIIIDAATYSTSIGTFVYDVAMKTIPRGGDSKDRGET